MNREENSDSIPNDIILEILSRLPINSIERFRCVSKLWGSMLHKPYFNELFLTRSLARPRLLIGVRQHREWSFFLAPQPHNHYGKPLSLVVAADFHIKCSLDNSLAMCRYASGLLYFPSLQLSCKDEDGAGVICNPITGQFEILHRLRLGTGHRRTCVQRGPITSRDHSGGLIGFDPIGGQFKVLSMNNTVNNKMARYILTLGTEKERWRKIQCPYNEDDRNGGVCINGILYFTVYDCDTRSHLIACFDVRFEKFKFLDICCQYGLCTTLINYEGKLGVIKWKCAEDGGFPLELCMWVLEDLEKQEWSKFAYTLKADNKVVQVDDYNLSVVGVTASGDIVLIKETAFKPFYVFYFNPERNHLLSVEIQGLGEDHDWSKYHAVCAFVDYVEDLQFNIMQATSLNPLEQNHRPRSTSTLSREDLQVRTVSQLGQDRRTLDSFQK